MCLPPSYHLNLIGVHISTSLLAIIRFTPAAFSAPNQDVEDEKKSDDPNGSPHKDENCVVVELTSDVSRGWHEILQNDTSRRVQKDGWNDAERLVGPKQVIQRQDDHDGDADAAPDHFARDC